MAYQWTWFNTNTIRHQKINITITDANGRGAELEVEILIEDQPISVLNTYLEQLADALTAGGFTIQNIYAPSAETASFVEVP